jgi:hypothetical protein
MRTVVHEIWNPRRIRTDAVSGQEQGQVELVRSRKTNTGFGPFGCTDCRSHSRRLTSKNCCWMRGKFAASIADPAVGASDQISSLVRRKWKNSHSDTEVSGTGKQNSELGTLEFATRFHCHNHWHDGSSPAKWRSNQQEVNCKGCCVLCISNSHSTRESARSSLKWNHEIFPPLSSLN